MHIEYGIKLSDRIKIEKKGSRFFSYIDGEHVGTHAAGRAAAIHATHVLSQRQKLAADARQKAAEEEAENQVRQDDAFLSRLESQLGLEYGDMEHLLTVIRRRLNQ